MPSDNIVCHPTLEFSKELYEDRIRIDEAVGDSRIRGDGSRVFGVCVLESCCSASPPRPRHVLAGCRRDAGYGSIGQI